MDKEMYNRAYEKAKADLANMAIKYGWEFYSIIEDSYFYEFGLTLIAYADEDSMRGTTENIEELSHLSIDLLDYVC